jgi:hypothetical protein
MSRELRKKSPGMKTVGISKIFRSEMDDTCRKQELVYYTFTPGMTEP